MENSTILKPNIQLFADGGAAQSAEGNSSATAAGTGSTAATGAETGTQTAAAQAATSTQTVAQETQPFKSFASEADYQKELDFKVQQALKTHEEKLKGKLTPEIRKQLEAEANMTAEQKVQAQLDEIATQKSELAKEKNRIKAESLLVKGGITDEVTRSTMLDSIVGEDETETLKRAKALTDAVEKATNEKIRVAMKNVKTPNTGANDGNNKPKDTIGKILGERRAKVNEAANKTLDYYRYGGKKV